MINSSPIERSSVRDTPGSVCPSRLSKLNRSPRSRWAVRLATRPRPSGTWYGVTERREPPGDPGQELQGDGGRRLELQLERDEELIFVLVAVGQHDADLGIEEQRDHVAEVELPRQTDGPHDAGRIRDGHQKQRRMQGQVEVPVDKPVHEVEADVVIDVRATVVLTGQAQARARERLPAHGERVQEADLDGVRERIVEIGSERGGLAEEILAGVDQQGEARREQPGRALHAAPNRHLAHGRATDRGDVAATLDHLRRARLPPASRTANRGSAKINRRDRDRMRAFRCESRPDDGRRRARPATRAPLAATGDLGCPNVGTFVPSAMAPPSFVRRRASAGVASGRTS